MGNPTTQLQKSSFLRPFQLGHSPWIPGSGSSTTRWTGARRTRRRGWRAIWHGSAVWGPSAWLVFGDLGELERPHTTEFSPNGRFMWGIPPNENNFSWVKYSNSDGSPEVWFPLVSFPPPGLVTWLGSFFVFSVTKQMDDWNMWNIQRL